MLYIYIFLLSFSIYTFELWRQQSYENKTSITVLEILIGIKTSSLVGLHRFQ